MSERENSGLAGSAGVLGAWAAAAMIASPASGQDAEPVIAGAPAAAGGSDGSQSIDPAAGGSGPPPASPLGMMFLPMILIFFVLMLVMTSRSQRKERKKRDEMLGGIKRNDLVQTVGGIIGTVVESSDKEFLIRVDDQSNTRMRFARSSVQTVLSSRGGSSESEPADPALGSPEMQQAGAER